MCLLRFHVCIFSQVVKNRFDGDLGIIPLTFNKDSLTMSPPVKPKVKRPTKGPKTEDGEEQGTKTEGEQYDLFEGMMLKGKHEDEIGIGEWNMWKYLTLLELQLSDNSQTMQDHKRTKRGRWGGARGEDRVGNSSPSLKARC